MGSSGGSIDLLVLGYPVALQQFTFASTDFGYTAGEAFADGPWQFTLSVTSGGATYSETWTAMFRNGFLCCADDQAKSVTDGHCDCDKITKSEKRLMRTQMNLAAVEYAENCQDVESGTIAMQKLNELCSSSSDCGCS